MTTTTHITRDAAHCQVQFTASSPRREMCDVTTAMFVINHTSVEMLRWVVARLVTALQMYFTMMTITMVTRDAAHHQVQVTVMSPVGEMWSVTTQHFTTQHTRVAMENVRTVTKTLCVRLRR